MTGTAPGPSERTQAWASTMAGHVDDRGIVTAHADGGARLSPYPVVGREQREQIERAWLRPGATLADGAGDRADPSRPMPTAPASNATATGSCTPVPSGGWRVRPRSSSSRPTTSEPG